MRHLAFCSCLAVLFACAKAEKQPAADTAAAAPEAPAMPAALSLANVTGKWAMRVMADTGSAPLVKFDLVAGADTSGWTFNFPKRKPIPIRIVALAGDSIVTQAGPYESVLRKGVQVTTQNTMRLQNGKLVGITVARYATSAPDSVVRLRIEGTRAP